MGLAIALFLFGLICGALVRNRAAAMLGAPVAAVAAWYLIPMLQPMLAGSATGRRWSELLTEAGAGEVSLTVLLSLTVLGVVVAWVLFRGHDHRPDWEWDPDHPKRRNRRRRRYAHG
jgi:hypothetical protein